VLEVTIIGKHLGTIAQSKIPLKQGKLVQATRNIVATDDVGNIGNSEGRCREAGGDLRTLLVVLIPGAARVARPLATVDQILLVRMVGHRGLGAQRAENRGSGIRATFDARVLLTRRFGL